jgi:hypothetical protein
MGGGAATIQLVSVVLTTTAASLLSEKVAWVSRGAHLIPQPVKLGMMQPKERVIRREAFCHALAIILR